MNLLPENLRLKARRGSKTVSAILVVLLNCLAGEAAISSIYEHYLRFDYCASIDSFEEGTIGRALMHNLCQSAELTERCEITENIETPIDSLMLLLVQGYDSLYSRPQGVVGLAFFMDAYHRSSALGGDAHKLVLLSLQHFFSKLLYSDHQNHDPYFSEYRSLARSDLEMVWLHKWETEFWGKSVSQDAWKYLESSWMKFDAQLQNIDPSSQLHILGLSNHAVLLGKQEAFEEALQKHQEVLEQLKDKPYCRFLAIRSYQNMTLIKTKQKDYEEGIQLADQLAQMATGADSNKIMFAVHSRKAAIYKELKEYEKAHHHSILALRHQIRTNYLGLAMQASAAEVAMRTLQSEKNFLAKDAELKEERLRTTRLTSRYLAAISGLLLLALILFYRSRLSQLQKKQAEIDLENEQQRSQLQAVNARIDGEEGERLKIAEFLHDHVSGSLAALKIHIGLSSKTPETSLEQSKFLIDEISTDVRSLAYEVFPSVLIKRSFPDALQDLCNNYSSRNLQVQFHDKTANIALPQEVVIKLFYAVKELLTNVLKHSGATKASVEMLEDDSHLELRIADNGKGFSEMTETGLGLLMIRSRVASLGGSLQTLDQDETMVVLRIPKNRFDN